MVKGTPQGQGTSILSDGRRHLGQWKDRKKHDQDPGPDRIKFVDEFKDDYSWEGIVYDKDGNAIATLSESVRKSAN